MQGTTRTLQRPGQRVASTALANTLAIKSNGAGELISLVGYNHGPEQYIQLHDSAAAPANGAVPLLTFKVKAGATFSLDTQIPFIDGLHVCNSSVVGTLTAAAADCWFLAQRL